MKLWTCLFLGLNDQGRGRNVNLISCCFPGGAQARSLQQPCAAPFKNQPTPPACLTFHVFLLCKCNVHASQSSLRWQLRPATGYCCALWISGTARCSTWPRNTNPAAASPTSCRRGSPSTICLRKYPLLSSSLRFTSILFWVFLNTFPQFATIDVKPTDSQAHLERPLVSREDYRLHFHAEHGS